MNPMMVAKNRNTRLAAEANVPAYSTSTPPVKAREHMTVVEIDSLYGRYWSAPMVDSEVESYIAAMLDFDDAELSDIDHAAACWCFKN